MTSSQLLGLYQKYCEQHPNLWVSKGSFFNLKPFYIRNGSKQHIEMCLCKLHLHAQWSVNSLLQWTRKVGVNINANNFRTFLGILMVDCPSEQHTHISWECTPNKKSVCDHVTKNWSELKQRLQDVDDQTTTV